MTQTETCWMTGYKTPVDPRDALIDELVAAIETLYDAETGTQIRMAHIKANKALAKVKAYKEGRKP